MMINRVLWCLPAQSLWKIFLDDVPYDLTGVWFEGFINQHTIAPREIEFPQLSYEIRVVKEGQC